MPKSSAQIVDQCNTSAGVLRVLIISKHMNDDIMFFNGLWKQRKRLVDEVQT